MHGCAAAARCAPRGHDPHGAVLRPPRYGRKRSILCGGAGLLRRDRPPRERPVQPAGRADRQITLPGGIGEDHRQSGSDHDGGGPAGLRQPPHPAGDGGERASQQVQPSHFQCRGAVGGEGGQAQPDDRVDPVRGSGGSQARSFGGVRVLGGAAWGAGGALRAAGGQPQPSGAGSGPEELCGAELPPHVPHRLRPAGGRFVPRSGEAASGSPAKGAG